MLTGIYGIFVVPFVSFIPMQDKATKHLSVLNTGKSEPCRYNGDAVTSNFKAINPIVHVWDLLKRCIKSRIPYTQHNHGKM